MEAIPAERAADPRLYSSAASCAAWSGLLRGDLDAARGWLGQLSHADLVAVRLAASMTYHLAEQALVCCGASGGAADVDRAEASDVR